MLQQGFRCGVAKSLMGRSLVYVCMSVGRKVDDRRRRSGRGDVAFYYPQRPCCRCHAQGEQMGQRTSQATSPLRRSGRVHQADGSQAGDMTTRATV